MIVMKKYMFFNLLDPNVGCISIQEILSCKSVLSSLSGLKHDGDQRDFF